MLLCVGRTQEIPEIRGFWACSAQHQTIGRVPDEMKRCTGPVLGRHLRREIHDSAFFLADTHAKCVTLFGKEAPSEITLR